MRTLLDNRTGSTAVEFALVSPIFLLMVLSTLATGFALWDRNIISEVAAETARCVAVGGETCAQAFSGCAETAAVCYALRLAQDRGLADLAADHVNIEPSAAIGSAVFARVTIQYPFQLGGLTVMLSTEQVFPNA